MNAKPSASQKRPHAQRSVGSSNADLESFRDISDDVIESDFIPYACLFDPQTLVTKNGELIQIIKITGLGFDAQHQRDLRGVIRNAIQQYIPDETYALWLHTLRRRQQLVAPSHFPDKFSAAVDSGWAETHPASASFVNELYITIVKAGQGAQLKRLDQIMQSLMLRREANNRNGFLNQAQRELSQTVNRMLQPLLPYGARLLTVTERNGDYYSEQLEFLEKLTNLEERPMKVPLRDLSQVLSSGEVTFGHNAMEVRTAEGHRRFGCILTIKEYKESTLAGIDKFLDIPCELIVTQCFDFVGADAARKDYEKQARYLGISGDRELADWMEISRLQGNSGPRAFGEQQTTLFLIAGSVKQLEANVRLVQKSLSRIGMIAVREDLRFEECYWAQLPGNFPFISRKHSVDTQHLAGFATVQTQPMGNPTGSPWGPPVSVLTTVQDAPYFFNFHRENSAHTIVIGQPKSGRTSVTHFLLAQARRLQLNIWYIDAHGRGTPAIQAMGGGVSKPGTATCQLNPLAMDDTPANREFLAAWLTTLIDPEGKHLTQSMIAFFQSLIAELMALPREQRRLSSLLPIIRAQDAMLAQQFQRWCAGQEFGELFDMPSDTLSLSALSLIDISKYAGNVATRAPLAAYLLHRLTMALNGSPTLLVLDEGFDLLANPLFGPRSAAWMDFIATRNTGIMLMSEHVEQSGNYAFAPAIAARAASIFAMPDHAPAAEYSYGFGFSESDLGALAYMQSAQRHVLLKRGNQSTMLKMDLSNLGAHLTTLNGRQPLMPQKSAADTLSELMGYATTPMGAPA